MTDELFFDTDCLSSFLWINDTNILHTLYGGRIILPEPVYMELSSPAIPHIKQRADMLIRNKDASIFHIEAGTGEYSLYRSLIRPEKGVKQIGRGEAAGIALAKQYNGILASNNYKDIIPYVNKYGLKHTSTPDILVEAFEKNLITELDGNNIWNKMRNKNRMLPERTFSDYLKKNR